MRMRSFLLLSLAMSQGLSACGGDSASGVTVTDSAGVRFTLSSDAPTTFAEVDPDPILSIGGPDVAGPAQFHQIQSVWTDPQGRIWVGDFQSAELRIFHPDGSHWKTVGGRGEGPGEFLQIRPLGPLRDDSVAVSDNANARITLYDGDGTFVRTASLRSGDSPIPRAFGVFADGSVLAQLPRMLLASSVQNGQILADTVRLVRVEPDTGAQRLQAVTLGPRWLWTGRSQIPVPFTTNAGFAISGEAVHVVTGSAFRVLIFERGRLAEAYGVRRDERAVDEDDIEAYRGFIEEYVPEANARDYISVLDHPARPRVMPAYSRLMVASDGSVWAQLYSPDPFSQATWDVFSPAREWLGQVETPVGFMALSVRGDHLAGVWRDDLGVEHVRIHLIQPG